MDTGIIITCSIILATVLAVGITSFVVVRKIQRFSKAIFGTKDLAKGLENTRKTMSETPVSVHGMTNIYLPMIKKDFPQFEYELYRNKAQSVLRSYFNAIEHKNSLALKEECSLTLKNHVQGIIEDLNSRNVTEHFDQVVLHDTQISRYIKNGATVTILFEISVGYLTYTTDSNGNVVFGNRELKKQTIYDVGLVYVQDVDKLGDYRSALGLNCPNCGAPVKNLGSKFCEFCGSGVTEVNTRVWQFDSVNEYTVNKKQY